MKLSLGIFASHGGSNLQTIIDASKEGRLDAVPAVVISNNADSPALARARDAKIPGYHLSARTHPELAELDRAITDTLERHGVNLIVLAGYMKKLGHTTLERYHGQILNIHPALLPKYGGKGMYGRHVHEAVLATGERVTGVTIHLVDAEYDTGSIVAQCEVPVLEGDTVETLAERVLQREHTFYVETLQKISIGEITLPDAGQHQEEIG